jgi:hypothetical protein
VSDIDTALMDSLKVLDPERPIREADIQAHGHDVRLGPTTEVARLFDQLVGLAVSNARIALPNFYNIAIRIANVAARLAVLGLRLRDELGSSTSPKFIARLNICNANIHKAAD